VSRGCDAVERRTFVMELDQDERALVLAGLFELRFIHLEVDWLWEETAALAEKLGGDPSEMFFGAKPPGG
jgi:hypothetical protein